MNGLAFLLMALVVSLAGSAVLWARQRKPTSLDHGITEFQREMRALAPDERSWPDGSV
ncbi:MAG: hypothetical protein AB7O29_05795 [Acidimicrobiia bacterium]